MTVRTKFTTARASITGRRPATASSPDARGETPTADNLAASYARRSVKKHHALAAQHATNATRAQRDAFVVPDELCWGDDATSGTTMQRGGLDDLLQTISSHRATFTRLYVRDRDRAARTSDPRFTFFLEMFCKLYGVQLCYSTDDVHVEYGENDGGENQVAFILSALKSIKAHQELVDTRKRTIRGSRFALKAGGFINALAPYGYERWLVNIATGAFVSVIPENSRLRVPGHHVRLRVNEAEAVAVRAIFTGIAARKAYAAIARTLEAEAHPRPAEGPWCDNTVRDIARNPLHMGDYHFGYTRHTEDPLPVAELDPESPTLLGVLTKNYVPDAPITAALWAQAQKVMDDRAALDCQRKRANPDYLLTSILRCAACGDALFGHRQPERAGERARMYRHAPPRSKAAMSRPACAFLNRYLHAELLETVALDATRRILECDEVLRLARAAIARLQSAAGEYDHSAALAEARQALAEATRAAGEANLRAAKAKDATQRKIHDATMRQLASEVDQLTARVAHLTNDADRIAAAEARLPALEERLISLREAFDAATPEGRKSVVAQVVETMHVDFTANTVDVRVLAA